jgi:hypothetical protein
MNRALKITVVFPLAALIVGGTVGSLTGAGSSSLGCGPELALGFAGAASGVAEGRASVALTGDKIVTVRGGDRDAYVPAGVGKGLLRHVASAPERGTAYVTDRKGDDTIVVVRQEGVSQIAESGEVTHPAWSPSGALIWAVDFNVLKMFTPEEGALRSIAPPDGSRAIFSPVFTGPRELTAIVEEAVEGDTAGEDGLNNLWRYNLDSATWGRVTRFEGTAERWSVLRTPVVADDGTVFFVRLQGVASETRPPTFELWSLVGSVASKARDLPKEMFLAGANDQGLVWNVFDGMEWRLFQERGADLVDMGCGAVMVDPRAQPDPDIAADETFPTQTSRLAEVGAGEGVLGDGELAILLGDFGSRREAERVARRLSLRGLEVVDHEASPLAMAPGMWGVAKRLPPNADPAQALDELRRRFPGFEERSWIVSLAGRQSVG